MRVLNKVFAGVIAAGVGLAATAAFANAAAAAASVAFQAAFAAAGPRNLNTRLPEMTDAAVDCGTHAMP